MRYVLIALMLAGCGLNPEYRAAQEEKQIASYAESCKKLGFEEDTEKFSECKLRMYESNKNAEGRRRASAPVKTGYSCYQSGAWTHCN